MSANEKDILPLRRTYRTISIPDKGVSGRISASPKQLRDMAGLLGIEEVIAFEFTYTLLPEGRERFRLTGTFHAQAVQACVVTLDPVPETIDTAVDVEFWPEAMIAKWEEEMHDAPPDGSTDDPEPIVDGVLDVGRYAYERLATSLDPYPRSEGAAFSWIEEDPGGPETAESEEENPFAALKDWPKRKQ